MNKSSVISLLFVILCGCGEHEVKRMIIEPHPPLPVASTSSCHLQFSKEVSLKEAAIQAARISEECSFNDKDFEVFAEQELAARK